MGEVLRTLIVEDNHDDALLIMRELEKAGYVMDHVRVLDTAEAMSHAFHGRKWDIVIADCSMPYFSGSHALEMVRETDKDIAFIVVSGTIGEETVAEAIRAGADDYVSKDRLNQLAPAVERALKRAEARRGQSRKDDAQAESQ